MNDEGVRQFAKLDRCRGSLYGLAIGDALGAVVEFKQPGSFPPVITYLTGGPHDLNKGEWTDDTSMALALAASLRYGWDLNDQARRYVSWYQEGEYSVNGRCFDIGGTTRHALANFIKHEDATKSGLKEPNQSGNGGIMRIAPVAIKYFDLYPNNIPELFKLGAESSSVTHASKMCLAAAGYMTVVLAALINGESREKALSIDAGDCTAIEGVVAGSYKYLNPPDIKGTGFVVDSLEAALWAFWNSSSYEEAVLKAVNLGEDADTTGAICGQFAGAYWGESGIPKHLKDGLAKKEMIEEALEGLINAL